MNSNILRLYEWDSAESYGVSLEASPRKRGALEIRITVDGQDLAVYLGPSDAVRLAKYIVRTRGKTLATGSTQAP